MAFMDELKPFYGKWNWPLKDMQPGDYFIVDHARRDPEAVRGYVSMQGSRLGKYFSINARDPEHPGFTRVTCTLPPTLREEQAPKEMEPETLRDKMLEWYGLSRDFDFPWEMQDREPWTRHRLDAQAVKPPVVKRTIVEMINTRYGVSFEPDGIEIVRLPTACTFEQWNSHELAAMLE